MSGDIAILDLRLRRRLTIGYAIGIAAYALIVVALYPSFKNDTGLNQLSENGSAVAAALGASGSLTSPAGWLNVNLYANFVPLIVLLATIGYGASAVAGQDEDGTLGLIAAMPLSRPAITAGKLIALVAQALPVPIVTALCVLAGRSFDLRIDAAPLLGTTAGITLLGLLFGALALLIGAATGSRGTALGLTSAAAGIAYLIDSRAPNVHWLHPARYLSPFFYAVGDNQLQHGLPLGWAATLVVITVVFALAAVLAFNRLDVH
jgi:ABC-2 type transport system permease protein